MKEFMMIFRSEPVDIEQVSHKDMQASIKKWQDWIGSIAGQGKFSSTNRLGFQGKTIMADGVITDGPFAEVKEIVGGYIIVKADGIDDAMELAKGCPVLEIGGKVEVRDIMEINL